MKSHGNRKYTKDILKDIALKYSTRGEWQRKHRSSYMSSLSFGKPFHNSICGHMVKVSFSIPQLMCKKLFEHLLNDKCIYNDRITIAPQELDIYFSNFLFAVEYNGWRWHKMPDAISRDIRKIDKCKEMGIFIFVIHQTQHMDYEFDIKSQVKNNIGIINRWLKLDISPQEVDDINCQSVYADIINFNYKNLGDIDNKSKNCSSIVEFQKKYRNEYEYLKKSNKIHLIEHLRTRPYRVSDQEIIDSGKEYNSISDFRKNNYRMYDLCKRRHLLSDTTSHMTRLKTYKLKIN
jgi:hypothetical protein